MNIIQTFDNSILYFIQDNLHNSFMDNLMINITKLGNAGILWIIIGIILLCFKEYRKYGVMLLFSLILGLLVGNVVLKNLVERARPCWVDTSIHMLISVPHDFSFPSGHSMSSFAGATCIYYMNKKYAIFAYIIALLIAFSRLYLFVHYPSDVLVGAIIGIILSVIAIIIVTKFIEQRDIKELG